MVLKVKFIAIISLVLLLVIGTSTVIVIHSQEKKALESKLVDSATTNMIVSNSIKDAMKRNDRAAVKIIISDISENPEVIAMRIISTDGEILISNNKAEIGSKSRGFVLQGYKTSGTNSMALSI